MPTRTRVLVAVIAALVVGTGAMGHDRWSAARAAETRSAASQMGAVRSILLGLAAGFVLLAATGLRRPPDRRP